jgi:hypothetical protein
MLSPGLPITTYSNKMYLTLSIRTTKAVAAGLFVLMAILSAADRARAQGDGKYTYEAQAAFIPEELGKVYLGMPFKEFAANFDFAESEIGDTRFGPLPVKFKFEKGPVRSLFVSVHGLTSDQMDELKRPDTVREPNGWEKSVVRLDPGKIPDAGIIYELGIFYDPEYDLRSYVMKKFGEGADIRKPDDEYHFYDVQWVKKTSDGLQWLIRVFDQESKNITLIGRIDGTPWGLDQL